MSILNDTLVTMTFHSTWTVTQIKVISFAGDCLDVVIKGEFIVYGAKSHLPSVGLCPVTNQHNQRLK